MSDSTSRVLQPGRVVRLADLADYSDGAIVSKTLVRNDSGTLTLFSFEEGQGLSEHTAPYDAVVTVLDGTAQIRIEGEPRTVREGETVLMPAHIPHMVQATSRMKMLLVMIRDPAPAGMSQKT